MTITEFLEARIAEDEIEARVCLASPEHTTRRWVRMLAECKAKRVILKEHELDLHMSESYCDTCAEWWKCELGEGPPPVKYPCPTVRALAAVYKDHPDYRQEWAL